jgi:hypothetical protein
MRAPVTPAKTQLAPEIEHTADTAYVARVVVFALMCLGCVLGALLWVAQVTLPCLESHFSPLFSFNSELQAAAHKVFCKII